MMFAILLVLGMLSSASARCDNACSGHGTCNYDDVCSCFDNWGVGLSMDSGDCSERICPFELAWVDTPNHFGTFHKYAECAGKGICNRGTGLCECFEGYEGKGCQRTSCPSDCSGHGTCEYIEDIQYAGEILSVGTGVEWDDARDTWSYHGWDKQKTRGCVCDAQYTDVDCSKRMCPYGTDVLDQRDNLLLDDTHQTQRLEFNSHNITKDGIEMLQGQTFAITFRSKLNETFTTIPISFDVTDTIDMANDIRLALLTLPNKVIDGVTVVANANSTDFTVSELSDVNKRVPWGRFQMLVDITFTGDSVQGPQHLLNVVYHECAHGCSPKITGLDIFAKTTNPTITVAASGSFDAYTSQISNTMEKTASDFNSYECGRRGKCDYGTGLCECFAGYTGENCNTLTTLV